MPKYRFSWSNLDHELLVALVGQSAEPEVSPDEFLRRSYGARPSEELVRDKWKVLLEHWLAEEPTARAGVVTAMRSRNIGDLSVDVSTPEGSLEYLGGLRNTSGLRKAVLRELIRAGERDSHDEQGQVVVASSEAGWPRWPWTTPQPAAGGAVDVGPQTLARLADLWQADEEWLISTPRHLRWWPFPIPVDLRAADPRLMFGDPTVKVGVDVRLFEGASNDGGAAAALVAAANMYASAAATWFDPDDGSVHVTTTAYAHEGNESVLRLYSALALIGVIEASLRARGLAEVCGAELLMEPHPITGMRQGTDEILEFVVAEVVPAGQRHNTFESYDFEGIAASLLNMGVASGGAGGLSVEFPLTPPGQAVPDEVAGPLGLGPTYLYQQMTNAPHPNYGTGLFCLLSVPLVGVDEDGVFVLANQLNRAEATELTGFPAWGAWVPHASHTGWLAHVAFIPALLADPGVPATLGFHAFLRSHWVDDRIREHTRGA